MPLALSPRNPSITFLQLYQSEAPIRQTNDVFFLPLHYWKTVAQIWVGVYVFVDGAVETSGFTPHVSEIFRLSGPVWQI